MSDTTARIECSNTVLALLDTKTTIERRRGGWYVRWFSYTGAEYLRRWHCRGQDFYPSWKHEWPQGGTRTTALSQLVRWCGDKPVLPMATWEYWCGKTVQLGRDKGPEILEAIRAGGYPETVPCVLCHETIVGGLDWWSLNGVTGPCCDMTSGCKQKIERKPNAVVH